jgi:CRISPR/Cas system-associated protein Csx1
MFVVSKDEDFIVSHYPKQVREFHSGNYSRYAHYSVPYTIGEPNSFPILVLQSHLFRLIFALNGLISRLKEEIEFAILATQICIYPRIIKMPLIFSIPPVMRLSI